LMLTWDFPAFVRSPSTSIIIPKTMDATVESTSCLCMSMSISTANPESSRASRTSFAKFFIMPPIMIPSIRTTNTQSGRPFSSRPEATPGSTSVMFQIGRLTGMAFTDRIQHQRALTEAQSFFQTPPYDPLLGVTYGVKSRSWTKGDPLSR